MSVHRVIRRREDHSSYARPYASFEHIVRRVDVVVLDAAPRRVGTRIGRQMDDRLEAIERFREALDRIEGRDRRGMSTSRRVIARRV